MNEPALITETKQDPGKIKIGDTVIVTCPELVVRVGYPLSYEEAKKQVEEKHDAALRKFLHDTGLYPSYPDVEEILWKVTGNWPPQGGFNFGAYKDIIKGMTRMHLNNEGYGGKARTVHTHRHESMLGKTYQVIGKRIAKTGVYYPPGCSQPTAYGGDYDSWPGGLKDEKTHVILQLNSCCWSSYEYLKGGPFSIGDWIAKCNVRKANG